MSEKLKVGLLLSGIIIIALLGNLYYKYLETLPHKYTIGTVMKIAKPAKGDLTVQYYYFVDSIKYTEVTSLGDYKIKKGERYLVKYPISYEGEGLMLLDEPIHKNLTAPMTGWNEKPDLNNPSKLD